MTTKPAWQVTLAPLARRDLIGIIRWTAGRFGQDQARRYGDSLRKAIATLGEGPRPLGSRAADDLADQVRRLPVGRHAVFYRARGPREIQIVRILHAAMDPARHLGGAQD